MFCNTKYYCYLVTAFVVVSSSVLFADGVCSISQEPSGHYVINCNGDGLQVRYEDITNEVYVISNCEELKSQLTSAVGSLLRSSETLQDYSDQVVNSCDEALSYIDNVSRDSVVQGEPYLVSQLNTAKSKVNEAKGFAISAALRSHSIGDELDSLQNTVDGIECGSCPESGGGESGDGSCCEPTDLSGVIELLNDISTTISDIHTQLDYLQSDYDLDTSLGFIRARLDSLSSVTYNRDYLAVENSETMASYIGSMSYNLGVALPSLNNYFYYLTQKQLKPVYDSLFASQQSPLYFYEPTKYDNSDGSHNYYSYLTNFYVEVAFGKSNSSLTNWFVRVEALLAALVLSDNKSTNTVDRSYGDTQKTQLTQSLQGLSGGPSTVLNQVNDVGQGIVQSITVIHNSLSKFSSPSSNVTIANVGDDVSISFESSEITYLVNACRCVTTLIWTFGGLWLLFIFVYWCFKQAYNLFVFCYSICSSIFGGGGAK